MALEIERRFLVADEAGANGLRKAARIRQGYIAIGAVASVRVRISGKAKATLTIRRVSTIALVRGSEISHSDVIAGFRATTPGVRV